MSKRIESVLYTNVVRSTTSLAKVTPYFWSMCCMDSVALEIIALQFNTSIFVQKKHHSVGYFDF